MSEQPRDGGPAFPTTEEIEVGRADVAPGLDIVHRDTIAHTGMTLRDYFAGQIVAGFSTTSEHYRTTSEHYRADMLPAIAEGIYAIADALLEERAKTNG